MDRLEEERNTQFTTHMGPYYQDNYKSTKKELEDKLVWRLGRIKRMKELTAPAVIIENEQVMTDQLARDIVKRNFLKSDADRAYREGYLKRESEFKFVFEVRGPTK